MSSCIFQKKTFTITFSIIMLLLFMALFVELILGHYQRGLSHCLQAEVGKDGIPLSSVFTYLELELKVHNTT